MKLNKSIKKIIRRYDNNATMFFDSQRIKKVTGVAMLLIEVIINKIYCFILLYNLKDNL